MADSLAIRFRLSSLIIVAVAVAFYGVFIWRTAFWMDGHLFFTLRDDAMISMRYAANLAHGDGLVWNVGAPPVEGYTNFLWVVWMAVLHLLPVPEGLVSLLVSVSGAAILVGCVFTTGLIARELSGRFAAGVAMILTALYYPIAYWTLRGMEVGLLALLVAAMVLQAVRWYGDRGGRRVGYMALFASLAVLTRPDAVVPAAVTALLLIALEFREGRDQRTAATNRAGMMLFGAIVLTMLAHTLFRLWYYGDPLPNTYYLKVTGVPLLERVSRGVEVFLPILRGHLIWPFVVALYGLWRAREFACGLIWAILASLAAYSIYVGGDAWEYFRFANRYITVGMPLLFALSGAALSGLRDDLAGGGAEHRGARIAMMSVLFLLGLLAVAAWADESFVGWYRQVEGLVGISVVIAVALWFASYSWPLLRRLPVTPIALTAVIVAGLNTDPWLGQWLPRAGAGVAADNARARLGMLIERSTAADVTIGVTAAGNIPYFAHRRTEDFLGKVDPVVARLPPRDEFVPGHDRWDYEYSIGRLRPDLIVQLWSPTEIEYIYMATLGYRDVFGLASSTADDGLPCGGYMGAHGLACSCQDGSFFPGLTCDLLVRGDTAGVDVNAIINGWESVRAEIPD